MTKGPKMETRTLSFQIPKPLEDGQCNSKCPFFLRGVAVIGDDNVSDDDCDLGYGFRKCVESPHPIRNIIVDRLFPYHSCPWAK